MLRLPGFHPGTGNGNDAAGSEGLSQQLLLALQQFHQHQAVLLPHQGGPDLQRGEIRGGDVQIFDIGLFPYIQPDFPVQTAVGQIVDNEAKGRHLGIFGGVQLHRQQVFPTRDCRLGDVRPEGCIAAPVVGHFLAVEVHRGNVSGAVKLQEQPLPCQLFSQLQFSAVAADHLVGSMVGVMQRDLLHRMGQPDRFRLPDTGRKFFRPVFRKFPVVAKAQHSKAPL